MSNPTSSSETCSLKEKTATITGGSHRIGVRIAIHFARKGMSNLAITYRVNETEAEKTLAKYRKLGVNAITIQTDITDPTIRPKIVKDALSGLDVTKIDILVNNAALSDISRAPDVRSVQAESFGGRVINISSLASMLGNSDPMITYGATKAALDSFTRSFASTFSAATGIAFNSVAVGPTETDALAMINGLIPGFLDTQIAMSTAANRVGNMDDVAYIVGFLASEEGRWVNGASVSANGGHRETRALFG